MSINYSREVEIKYKADVFVAGGGPSGVAAAVSAARNGKNVILAEQSGSMGGASVLAMVAELMNFDDGKNFLCGGIGKEIFDALGLKCLYKREWYNIKSEKIKRVYDSLAEQCGVKILFYTKIIDVITDGDKISHAIVSGVEGIYAVSAKMFIDCTGCGSLCDAAGIPWEYGDDSGRTMPATICTLWGGVDFDEKQKGKDYDMYEKAFDDGIFSQYDKVLPGIKPCYTDINVGVGNVGHCFNVNDTDTESMSFAMINGRKILQEYEKYYRNYVAGCEKSELIKSADFIGIRESRRVRCLYMLTEDDFFSGKRFEDEIGRYSYPIDIHPMTPDKAGMEQFDRDVSKKHSSGESYSIPYRSIVPERIKNILVAGRCIGADRSMQASVRVIPCCYITGQAAGTASAICIDTETNAHELDVSYLRKKLHDMGAYLQ